MRQRFEGPGKAIVQAGPEKIDVEALRCCQAAAVRSEKLTAPRAMFVEQTRVWKLSSRAMNRRQQLQDEHSRKGQDPQSPEEGPTRVVATNASNYPDCPLLHAEQAV
ncbi:unnamed protein product [Nesidiocoris tenuis]|uniref:Uncharacterized protein n=2 Tax=Nesidiocoris tenuis TaxID=355587 RepID=A0A6H5GPK6_9HEMI|nr:Hypothetical protein NTJ_05630 [Nesidiocoris tenuis]CAB0006004.1 unnamed protein product [Nesidiocoris tenuis]